MGQLFNNYSKRSINIPDNTSDYLELPTEYDEVIVLGADNTHCFKLPHLKKEIISLKVIYNQGTETKLVKQWSKSSPLGSPIHWDYDGDESDPDTYYSLISFDVTAEDTAKFSEYNQDTSVQIFTTITTIEDTSTDETDTEDSNGKTDATDNENTNDVVEDYMTANATYHTIFKGKLVPIDETITGNYEKDDSVKTIVKLKSSSPNFRITYSYGKEMDNINISYFAKDEELPTKPNSPVYISNAENGNALFAVKARKTDEANYETWTAINYLYNDDVKELQLETYKTSEANNPGNPVNPLVITKIEQFYDEDVINKLNTNIETTTSTSTSTTENTTSSGTSEINIETGLINYDVSQIYKIKIVKKLVENFVEKGE